MKKLSDMNEIVDIPSAFFNELCEIAEKDKNVLFLTADQGAWALERFRKKLPDQFFNIGISEQNMISLAAGLTMGGKRIFLHAITPFMMQRCFEQVKLDICLGDLPVTLVGSGSSLTYSVHGPTHQALEDLSMMRVLPRLTILNPCEQYSAQAAARIAYECDGPVYVKIEKGSHPILYNSNSPFQEGVSELKKGDDLCIIGTGIMTQKAFLIAEQLKKASIEAGIIDIFKIKPLNEKLFLKKIRNTKAIATVEEHTIIGGIGSAICELLTDRGINIPIIRFGINDEYCERCGDRDWLNKYYGLDVVTVSQKLKDWMEHGKIIRNSVYEKILGG